MSELDAAMVGLVRWSYGVAGYLDSLKGNDRIPEFIKDHFASFVKEHNELVEKRRIVLGISKGNKS